MKEGLQSLFNSRKSIIGAIILALVILSVPLVVRLAQERQIFPSRAETKIGSNDDGQGGCCGDHLNEAGDDTAQDNFSCFSGEDCSTPNGACASSWSCTPIAKDCGCQAVSSICEGSYYIDDCGQTCWGTKDCSIPSPTPTSGGRPLECSPGEVQPFKEGNCTGYCPANCSNMGNSGEARVYVCSSDGKWVERSWGECREECAYACSGGPTPTTPAGATPTPPGLTPPGGTTGCQANTGIKVGDYDNSGLVWRKDCSSSCGANPQCPTSKDGYILQKFSEEDTNWCLSGNCAQPAVINPLGGTVSCDGSPTCNYGGIANPQVALNVSWQGLRECWDLGGAGTTCNYVGADLCVKVDKPSHTYLCGGDNPLCVQGGVWKLVASGGSDPATGKVLFPDGSFSRVPPSGGISWIRSGLDYEFALFEDAYTATKQRCSSSSDTDCLDHQYLDRACKGKEIVRRTITTIASTPSQPTNTPVPSGPIPTFTPSPTPTPTTRTADYRVSATVFAKDAQTPAWEKYDSYPMNRSFNFPEAKPGDSVTVFVQFRSTTGELSNVEQKTITYIGSGPVIKNTTCGYSPTGEGTDVIIYGQNFGEQGSGKVLFNGQEAQIISWIGEVSEPTPTSLPAEGSSSAATPTLTSNQVLGENVAKSVVAAHLKDSLQEGKPIPVKVIASDGRETSTQTCTINLTTLSFNAKAQCRPPENFTVSKAKVQIYEKTMGARPVFEGTITIDARGLPQWTTLPKLEVGKEYVMVVKGPQLLGYKKEFKAFSGTTALEDLNLLAGDIAPLSSPDNIINANDFSELKREWTTVTDVTRPADLNLDNRVNSIDYSCLRNNFNQSGASFLKAQ